MNIVYNMVKTVTKLTIILSIILVGVGVWFDAIQTVLLSVLFSTCVGLINFNIIVYSTVNLNNIVTRSYFYYILRLAISGVMLGIGLYFNLNIILLFLGLLTNKVAIIVYGLLYKEVKNGL